MKLEMVQTRDLQPAKYNPRKDLQPGDPEYDAIKRSMDRFGYVDPIIVNSDMTVIGGHQRLKIFIEEGRSLIPVIIVDIDKREEKALNIALNKTGGDWDYEKLREALEDLSLEGFDLTFTGFTLKEIDKLMKSDEEKIYDDKYIQPIFPTEELVEETFQYFRRKGFPYPNMPRFIAMQQINELSTAGNLGNLSVGHKIADSFMHHRYNANANGMKSPLEAYEDDQTLRKLIEIGYQVEPSLKHEFLSFWGYVQGIQIVRNFPPAAALHYYRLYSPIGGTVMDTSLGYGGRLIAYIASNIRGKYIGIDPNRESCDAALAIKEQLGQHAGEIELVCSPVEDIPLEQYKGVVDIALTSPPYFTKEIYSTEETQSCNRYPKPKEWREGFLEKMLIFQYTSLKPGGMNIINIADVKIGSKKFNLEQWTIEDAKKTGFEFIAKESLERKIAGTVNKESHETKEPILLFKKPEEKT